MKTLVLDAFSYWAEKLMSVVIIAVLMMFFALLIAMFVAIVFTSVARFIAIEPAWIP